MNINVFLLCFNESNLIQHTIKHYKKYLPSCKITIYDNESTDNSVEIAKKLGCSVISWNSNNVIDDFKYVDIKNNCWKSIEKGWIIMADMDEFLCVTEEELMKEMESDVSILNIKGYDMIGESETDDLSDIDLQNIKKYIDNHYESKKLCFLREKINEINYNCGAHACDPKGNIIYSSTVYINKHMSSLGLKFLTNKYIERYKRAENMRKHGMATHYTSDIDKIKNLYTYSINNCKNLD
jgi:hypothetical protein